MRTYTKEEVEEALTDLTKGPPGDFQTDNTGQMVIYTGLFNWADGSVRDEPDPSYEE